MSVALKLRDEHLRNDRINAELERPEPKPGDTKVGALIAARRVQIAGDISIKSRTKEFWNNRLDALLRSWPGIENSDVRRITPEQCGKWAAEYAPTVAASTFNGTLAMLRQLFDGAVASGLRLSNPLSAIKARRPAKKDLSLNLPDRETFARYADSRVLVVTSASKAMKRAASILSIPPITHHDLRHLFATTCIESGVDIPALSKWLGHKDGGALAMKTYGHLRDQHSKEMAKQVVFYKHLTGRANGLEI